MMARMAIHFGNTEISSTIRRCHRYDMRINLGTYRHLKAETLVEDIKAAKIFPLVILEGQMKAVNDKAILAFPGLHIFKLLPFAGNEVIVTDVTERGVRIQACASHIFRGSVSHEIEQQGNELFYVLKGCGPPEGEEFLRYHANLFFAKYLWPILIKFRIIPYAKTMENRRQVKTQSITGDCHSKCK